MRSVLLAFKPDPKRLSQPEEVGQFASSTAGTSLLLTNPGWEVSFRFSGWWSRSGSSFFDRSGSSSGGRSWNHCGSSGWHSGGTTVGCGGGATASGGGRTSTTGGVAATACNCTGQVTGIGNFVTTQAQTLFRSLTNLLVAVTQSTHQSLSNFLATAAAISLELSGDFDSSLVTNAFISVVQGIDESAHDFWVTATIASAEAVQGCTAFFSVASGL